jgi:hypothetical protein
MVPDAEFLEAAADALDGLDFAHRAEEVRAWAGESGSPDALADHDELAAACLSAAIRSNERDASAAEAKDTRSSKKETRRR